MIRQRYSVSEIIETGDYTFVTFSNKGYAIKTSDYIYGQVDDPYYKFHKGFYQRCYGFNQELNSSLQKEKKIEWYNSPHINPC